MCSALPSWAPNTPISRQRWMCCWDSGPNWPRERARSYHMTIQPHPYTGANDLKKIKALLTEGWQSGLPGYIHIGDIDWWIYYDPRHKDHHHVIWLWEDKGGRLL